MTAKALRGVSSREPARPHPSQPGSCQAPRKASRIRPTAEDHRFAELFRWYEAHPDAIDYLGHDVGWIVWTRNGLTNPTFALLEEAVRAGRDLEQAGDL